VVVLTVVFTRVDLHALIALASRIDPIALAASVLLAYVAWVVNSYKWKLLLRPYVPGLGVGELFRLNLAALFYGLVVPGQVSGEAIKAVRLARRTDQPHGVYLSVYWDRLTGMIGLALLGSISIVLAGPTNWVGSTFCLALLLSVSLIGLAAFLLPGRLTRAWDFIQTPAPIQRVMTRVERVLVPNGDALPKRTAVTTLALATLFQGLGIALGWTLAAGLGIAVGPIALGWITAIATLLLFLPVSIAGIGVREASYVGLLGLYSVAASQALALSLVSFGILILLAVSGGVFDLIASTGWRRGRRAMPDAD
jgi:uncharacterized membrane protein YbhN (UPF0104 family)